MYASTRNQNYQLLTGKDDISGFRKEMQHDCREALAKPPEGTKCNKPKLYSEINTSRYTSSFPFRLHGILDDVVERGETDIIAWRPHGKTFIIKDTKRFSTQIISRYFSHRNFTSFQRQLNIYGFQRLYSAPERGGYYHKFFQRGRPELCHKMKRRKINGRKVRQSRKGKVEPDFYSGDDDRISNAMKRMIEPTKGPYDDAYAMAQQTNHFSSPYNGHVFNSHEEYLNQPNSLFRHDGGSSHHYNDTQQPYYDQRSYAEGSPWQERFIDSSSSTRSIDTRPTSRVTKFVDNVRDFRGHDDHYDERDHSTHPSYHDHHNYHNSPNTAPYPPNREQDDYQSGNERRFQDDVERVRSSPTNNTTTTNGASTTPQQQLLQMKEKMNSTPATTSSSSPPSPAVSYRQINSNTTSDENIRNNIINHNSTSMPHSPSTPPNKKFRIITSLGSTDESTTSSTTDDNNSSSVRWKMYLTKEDVLKGMTELSEACAEHGIDCGVLQHVLPRQMLED